MTGRDLQRGRITGRGRRKGDVGVDASFGADSRAPHGSERKEKREGVSRAVCSARALGENGLGPRGRERGLAVAFLLFFV